jgi:hypothetical protein
MALVIDRDPRSEYVAVIGEDSFDVHTYTRNGWRNGEEAVTVERAATAAEAVRLILTGTAERVVRSVVTITIEHTPDLSATDLETLAMDAHVQVEDPGPDHRDIVAPLLVHTRTEYGKPIE